MATTVGTKSDPQPSVPEAQQFDVGSLEKAWEQFYKPQTSSDYMNMYSQMMARYPQDFNTMMQAQQAWFPQMLSNQTAGQTALYNNMTAMQRASLRGNMGTAYEVTRDVSPEFFDIYSQLGGMVGQGLSDGYKLGEGLTKEMEQSIRGAQMARGNWLGPAPTAQEAFGIGQASLNLYNQRLGQAQNYLQGRNPSDMAGQAWATFNNQPYYPSNTYVDSGLGASMVGQVGNQAGNVFSSIGQQQGNYNSALSSSMSNFNDAQLQANNQNNNWMFEGYDRTADSWMYREAARNGLYSQPSMGGSSGGMGGMGGMMGSIGGAVGTGMMGLAASGVVGAGATAAGVGIAGAAAGAAAAICWLARKLIPDCWKSWRKWLFTKASTEVRLDYLYNARRLANQIA